VTSAAPQARRASSEDLARLSMLTDALGRCRDLDEVLTAALDGLASLFGFDHSLLMMLDERGERLFTIASRGYPQPGIGSEVEVGVGVIGMVAAQRRPMRVLNVQRLLAYARTARPVAAGSVDAEREVPLPGLPRAQSQLAAPAMVMGQLLGVLGVESDRLGAFTAEDEQLLAVVAHLVASAIELDRIGGRALLGVDGPTSDVAAPSREPGPTVAVEPAAGVVLRHYTVDGSTFIDGEYLIKGVPGRILWRLLSDHEETGRTDFTNREVRLDPSLELPAYRDNLESRLILLKRRLDERGAPMRIDKTGRGRFRLHVAGPLRLERSGEG
jgi:adenylate cyclase